MLHYEAVPPLTLELLRKLCREPRMSAFGLVGGTSLALRMGHRMSVDLDFFTREPFDCGPIITALEQSFKVSRNRVGENSMALMVDDVKVDFAIYRDPWLESQEEHEGIRLWSLPDVVGMKLSAICNRGAKKDFYDVHALISRLTLPGLIDIYQRKFPRDDISILVRSLAYFSDAEEDANPVSLAGITWTEVKRFIAAEVKKLL